MYPSYGTQDLSRRESRSNSRPSSSGRAPKIAFIGSGGGAKGIAHLGVLKALSEFGVSADVFVGASAGAVAACFYAQGFDADEMVDWFRPFWKRENLRTPLKARHFLGLPNLRQLRSPGWLSSGLLSVDRFEKFLEKKLPHNDFRQLDRQLYVTATDIDSGKRVVFGNGYVDDVPISSAVAASCAVPLLFRPHRIGDRYYVDGELVRTLSMDLAIDAGADVLIVSNAYRPKKNAGASIATRGVFRVTRQATNIVLSQKEKRGMELLRGRRPDVTIVEVTPDLGEFSFTSRSTARRLLFRGYRQALKVLAQAKRDGAFAPRRDSFAPAK